jgi:hypothetical protein
MIIPLMFHLQAYTYVLAVIFIPSYRNIADAITMSEVGIVHTDKEMASPGTPEKEKESVEEKVKE